MAYVQSSQAHAQGGWEARHRCLPCIVKAWSESTGSGVQVDSILLHPGKLPKIPEHSKAEICQSAPIDSDIDGFSLPQCAAFLLFFQSMEKYAGSANMIVIV